MNHVTAAAARQPILTHGYFTGFDDGRMSREKFAGSQKQFFFAVRYFPRAMAALMTRIPDSASRQGLIHNIAEEHGFDDQNEFLPVGFDPAMAHDLTFVTFLRSLGVTRGEMAKEREGPGVRAFNNGLMGTCLMERTELAFACLGVIEFVFADICGMIGKKAVERGWVAKADLVHYKLHAQIDKRHAADFFRMVEPAWAAGGDARKAVEDGLLLGLHLFGHLYEDLDSE